VKFDYVVVFMSVSACDDAG